MNELSIRAEAQPAPLPPTSPDAASLAHTLATLGYGQGEVFELTWFLKEPGAPKATMHTRIFTNNAVGVVGAVEWLAEAASELRRRMAEHGGDDGGGCYIGSNPLFPDLASRTKRPADSDVAVVRALLLDPDPLSTAPGHRAAAAEVALELRDAIYTTTGVLVPLIDSGRGRQLWLPHEPVEQTDPNEPCALALKDARKSLVYAAQRLNCPGMVIVDKSTHNASRLLRLPSTVNAKTGDAARILDAGDGERVPVAALSDLAAVLHRAVPKSVPAISAPGRTPAPTPVLASKLEPAQPPSVQPLALSGMLAEAGDRPRPQFSPSQGVSLARVLAGLPAGERNSSLFAAACKLRSEGRDKEWAHAVLRQAAANCTPPFDSAEAEEIVDRVYRTYPAGHATPGSARDQDHEARERERLNDARATAEAAVVAAEGGDEGGDPGAPLDGAAVLAFAFLQAHDLPEFTRLKARLQGHTDLRAFNRLVAAAVADLDDAAAVDPARALLDAARERADVGVDEVGERLLRVKATGRVMPLNGSEGQPSSEAREWLRSVYRETNGNRMARAALIDSVLCELPVVIAAAAAGAEVPAVTTAIRVGDPGDGSLLIDLGTNDWTCIRVTSEGWSVVPHPREVWFRRGNSRPLPVPVRHATPEDRATALNELRAFLRLTEDHTWALIGTWCLSALAALGAFPILVLDGAADAGKTSLLRVLVLLLDPHRLTEGRSLPTNEEDLAVSFSGAHLLAYDNVSHISDNISDALCRCATGAGLARRTKFANRAESVFVGRKPILINGIEALPTRGDLASRSWPVTVPSIAAAERLSTAELERRTREMAPRVLGALLDALVLGLRDRHLFMDQARAVRMQDAAALGMAAAPALGLTPESMLASAVMARSHGMQAVLDSSPLARHVVEITRAAAAHGAKSLPMAGVVRGDDGVTYWSGTAQNLLDLLNQRVSWEVRPKLWPASARALSGALKRLEDPLKLAGVLVRRTKSGDRRIDLVDLDAAGSRNAAQPFSANGASGDEAVAA